MTNMHGEKFVAGKYSQISLIILSKKINFEIYYLKPFPRHLAYVTIKSEPHIMSSGTLNLPCEVFLLHPKVAHSLDNLTVRDGKVYISKYES